MPPKLKKLKKIQDESKRNITNEVLNDNTKDSDKVRRVTRSLLASRLENLNVQNDTNLDTASNDLFSLSFNESESDTDDNVELNRISKSQKNSRYKPENKTNTQSDTQQTTQTKLHKSFKPEEKKKANRKKDDKKAFQSLNESIESPSESGVPTSQNLPLNLPTPELISSEDLQSVLREYDSYSDIMEDEMIRTTPVKLKQVTPSSSTFEHGSLKHGKITSTVQNHTTTHHTGTLQASPLLLMNTLTPIKGNYIINVSTFLQLKEKVTKVMTQNSALARMFGLHSAKTKEILLQHKILEKQVNQLENTVKLENFRIFTWLHNIIRENLTNLSIASPIDLLYKGNRVLDEFDHLSDIWMTITDHSIDGDYAISSRSGLAAIIEDKENTLLPANVTKTTYLRMNTKNLTLISKENVVKGGHVLVSKIMNLCFGLFTDILHTRSPSNSNTEVNVQLFDKTNNENVDLVLENNKLLEQISSLENTISLLQEELGVKSEEDTISNTSYNMEVDMDDYSDIEEANEDPKHLHTTNSNEHLALHDTDFNKHLTNHANDEKLSELQSQYDSLVLSHERVVGEHESLNKTYDSLLNTHNTLQSAHGVLQHSYNELLSQEKKLHSAHNTLLDTHNALQNSHSTLVEELKLLRNDNTTLTQTIQTLKKEKQELNTKTNELLSEIEVLKKQLTDVTVDRDETLMREMELFEEVEEIKGRLDDQNHEQHVQRSSYESTITALNEKLNELNGKLKTGQTEMEERMDEAQKNNSLLSQEKEKLERKVEILEEEVLHVHQHMDSLQDESVELASQNQHLSIQLQAEREKNLHLTSLMAQNTTDIPSPRRTALDYRLSNRKSSNSKNSDSVDSDEIEITSIYDDVLSNSKQDRKSVAIQQYPGREYRSSSRSSTYKRPGNRLSVEGKLSSESRSILISPHTTPLHTIFTHPTYNLPTSTQTTSILKNNPTQRPSKQMKPVETSQPNSVNDLKSNDLTLPKPIEESGLKQFGQSKSTSVQKLYNPILNRYLHLLPHPCSPPQYQFLSTLLLAMDKKGNIQDHDVLAAFKYVVQTVPFYSHHSQPPQHLQQSTNNVPILTHREQNPKKLSKSAGNNNFHSDSDRNYIKRPKKHHERSTLVVNLNSTFDHLI